MCVVYKCRAKRKDLKDQGDVDEGREAVGVRETKTQNKQVNLRRNLKQRNGGNVWVGGEKKKAQNKIMSPATLVL